MKSYRLTPLAEDDLFEIWTFIACDNLTEADSLQAEILIACQKVAEKPDLGHFRRDLTDKPVRFFCVHRNYLIVYEPKSDPIQIIRVLHGARDSTTELEA